MTLLLFISGLLAAFLFAIFCCFYIRIPNIATIAIFTGSLLLVISIAIGMFFGHSFSDLLQLKGEISGQFVVRSGMGIGFFAAGLFIVIFNFIHKS